MSADVGYLQHAVTPSGPFRTEAVPIKLSGWRRNGQCWLARVDGRWRVVHVQLNRLYVVVNRERITIRIEGV